MTSLYDMRDRIRIAVAKARRPSPDVLAGWEGGSAAFGIVDAYSDIDLSFLVTDAASLDALYAISEEALREISPILASHNAPPGRYYKLRDAGDFLLLDLCFFRVSDSDYQLDVDRHGQVVPLFDKTDWLHASDTSDPAKATARRHWSVKGWWLECRRRESLAYALSPLPERNRRQEWDSSITR